MAQDYEVGYRKPPKHTRFKPGRSGNPRGRAKETRNLRTDLVDELAERILISEGGRRRADVKGRAGWVQLDLPRPASAARRTGPDRAPRVQRRRGGAGPRGEAVDDRRPEVPGTRPPEGGGGR